MIKIKLNKDEVMHMRILLMNCAEILSMKGRNVGLQIIVELLVEMADSLAAKLQNIAQKKYTWSLIRSHQLTLYALTSMVNLNMMPYEAILVRKIIAAIDQRYPFN